MIEKPKKVLIIGTNLMSLYNHRLELIQRLLDEGYQVAVAAPEGEEENKLKQIGCKVINLDIDTRGTNIKRDLKLLQGIKKLYRAENPNVVLTFYTKTNIYGGMVARQLQIPYIENICGLGTSLVKDNLMGKMMRSLYRVALKDTSHLFFQNKSNIKFAKQHNLYNGEYTLLPGSGVSLERYKSLPYPKNNNIEFLFCSRVLKDKGIDEYIKAAIEIKKKHPDTTFHVAGPCEPEYESVIEKCHKKGIIKYHGKLTDLHPLMERIHASVLPSYYPEGMANILLESAASGRPIITTNLPGCGETVEDGVTGFVVKEKDVDSLVNALERFISLSPDEKETMGLKGREKMEREFNREIVVDNYLTEIQKITS